MSIVRLVTVLAAMVGLAAAPAWADGKDVRHFMFIGEPNAEAWQFMMEHPEDRKASVEKAFKALGGEMLSYYFGLGDGKNYITVELPDDNEIIQAVYVMRLPSGLLNSYEVIELMPSAQMSEALKRSQEFIELEKSLGGGVE